MYALYSLLSAAALVLAAPWLAWQAVRHGKYRHRWRERLGRLPTALAAGTAPTLWLHAVVQYIVIDIFGLPHHCKGIVRVMRRMWVALCV